MAILNKMGSLRINVTLRRVGVDYCWQGKAKGFKYSGYVYEVIANQRARCMRRIMWPVWLYYVFPHYLINGMIFEKKLLNIKYMFLYDLPLLSEILLAQGRIYRYVITTVHRSSCKLSAILLGF
jgi:hypothetical protein